MPKAPKTRKPPKPLPRYLVLLLSKMRTGRLTLCRGYKPRTIGVTDRVECYWLEPSGEGVGPASARRAIREGHLKPLDRALLGDGNHQTWGLPPLRTRRRTGADGGLPRG